MSNHHVVYLQLIKYCISSILQLNIDYLKNKIKIIKKIKFLINTYH